MCARFPDEPHAPPCWLSLHQFVVLCCAHVRQDENFAGGRSFRLCGHILHPTALRAPLLGMPLTWFRSQTALMIVVVSLLALVLVLTEFTFVKKFSSLTMCIIGVVKVSCMYGKQSPTPKSLEFW